MVVATTIMSCACFCVCLVWVQQLPVCLVWICLLTCVFILLSILLLFLLLSFSLFCFYIFHFHQYLLLFSSSSSSSLSLNDACNFISTHQQLTKDQLLAFWMNLNYNPCKIKFSSSSSLFSLFFFFSLPFEARLVKLLLIVGK